MFHIKENLHRWGRKLLHKLETYTIYKWTLAFILSIVSPKKIFITTKKKAKAVVSVTTWKLFGKKVGYIDDFIVHKRFRGKGIGEKIFQKALEHTEKEKSEVTFLVSRFDRKASHKLYKKLGFAIVSLWIGIIAYKKHKK